MKSKQVLFFSFFIIFIFSCSDRDLKISNEQAFFDNDYYEYKGINFQKFAIPAMIMVPDETANIGTSTDVYIIHTENDFKWELQMGEKYIIHIEDYGDNKNLVAKKKKELEDKNWFEVKYLVDQKDFLVYQKRLKVKDVNKATSKVGVEHISYFVYAVKNIDGITYELRNQDEGNELEITRWIAKSIKSFKPLKSKQ
jgi:hypothetical protein